MVVSHIRFVGGSEARYILSSMEAFAASRNWSEFMMEEDLSGWSVCLVREGEMDGNGGLGMVFGNRDEDDEAGPSFKGAVKSCR